MRRLYDATPRAQPGALVGAPRRRVPAVHGTHPRQSRLRPTSLPKRTPRDRERAPSPAFENENHATTESLARSHSARTNKQRPPPPKGRGDRAHAAGLGAALAARERRVPRAGAAAGAGSLAGQLDGVATPSRRRRADPHPGAQMVHENAHRPAPPRLRGRGQRVCRERRRGRRRGRCGRRGCGRRGWRGRGRRGRQERLQAALLARARRVPLAASARGVAADFDSRREREREREYCQGGFPCAQVAAVSLRVLRGVALGSARQRLALTGLPGGAFDGALSRRETRAVLGNERERERLSLSLSLSQSTALSQTARDLAGRLFAALVGARFAPGLRHACPQPGHVRARPQISRAAHAARALLVEILRFLESKIALFLGFVRSCAESAPNLDEPVCLEDTPHTQATRRRRRNGRGRSRWWRCASRARGERPVWLGR